jgi:hypothetical protein
MDNDMNKKISNIHFLIMAQVLLIMVIGGFLTPTHVWAQCTQTACDALSANMATCQTNNCCTWVCPPTSTQPGCCICTDSSCTTTNQPPPLVCIPYAPMIRTGTMSGTIGSGQQCDTQIVDVPFGVMLNTEPVVALSGFWFEFYGMFGPIRTWKESHYRQ